LVLLLAALLRFGASAWEARFHPDEAWFATFARDAAVQGAWMLPGALDKPPLAIYAAALAMQFAAVETNALGVLDLDVYRGEWAARLPSALAGVVTVAAVYALADAVSRRRAAAGLAALLAALSSYGMVYSASAFTDGLMVMCMALAWSLAARGRAFSAGVWVALAFACKQQGIYALPLCLLLLPPRRWWALALPILAGVALVFVWDAARGQAVGIFAQASANNNPERALVGVEELLPRLRAWLAYGLWLVGVGGALVAWQRRGSRKARALLAFALAYFAAHIILPFNLYDRYLLPLLPLVCVLAAGALARLPLRVRVAALAGCAALALSAYSGHTPIGALASAVRDDAAFMGGADYAQIDAAADFLNAQALGAIIYDRWLGWQLGYYLGAWTDKRRVYYPTPRELAAGAAAQPDPAPRYLIVPAGAPYAPYLEALRGVGFAARRLWEGGAFRIYVLTR
jgi:4-amino-4-deoxy-L-arabinose transferase-like glycosyltransferase